VPKTENGTLDSANREQTTLGWDQRNHMEKMILAPDRQLTPRFLVLRTFDFELKILNDVLETIFS